MSWVPGNEPRTQDIVQDQHQRSLLTSNSEDGRAYVLRPEMIIQSGISSPSLTRRVRCFFQNELLTSQLSRRCCAARALMIRLLLNLLTRMFRNSALAPTSPGPVREKTILWEES